MIAFAFEIGLAVGIVSALAIAVAVSVQYLADDCFASHQRTVPVCLAIVAAVSGIPLFEQLVKEIALDLTV